MNTGGPQFRVAAFFWSDNTKSTKMDEMKPHIDPAIDLDTEQKKRKRRGKKKDYDPSKDPDQIKLNFDGHDLDREDWPCKRKDID